MTKKIGVGVIGSGRVAYSHLHAIKALNELTDLITVVDKIEEAAKKAAKKFKAKRFHTSIDDALNDPQVDAVIICLPHYLHAETCEKAANKGKHIFVEKPLTITLKEAQRVFDSTKKNGINLMVGQSQRFYDAIIASKKIVDEGKIGDILSINAVLLGYVKTPPTPWWSSEKKTGGLLIPLWGSHIIDYILWLFGKSPARVYAEAYSNNPNWEGEDEASIILGFENGTMASIIMSYNAHTSHTKAEGYILPIPQYNRFIIGTKGTIHLKDNTKLYLNGNKIVSGVQKPSIFYLQMKEFIMSIIEKRKPAISVDEALKVVQVMEASKISAKEHKLIRLN